PAPLRRRPPHPLALRSDPVLLLRRPPHDLAARGRPPRPPHPRRPPQPTGRVLPRRVSALVRREVARQHRVALLAPDKQVLDEPLDPAVDAEREEDEGSLQGEEEKSKAGD